MIPQLIAIESRNDLNIWFTDQKTYGVSFFINSVDLELDDIKRFENQITGFLRNVDMDLTVRFKTHIFDDPISFWDFSRKEDLKELTQTQRIISVHIEALSDSFLSEIKSIFQTDILTQKKLAQSLINKMRIDFLTEFAPISWTITDIRDYFHLINKDAVFYNDIGLSIGTKYYGILKLTDLGKYSLDTSSLGFIMQELATPFEMNITISKIDKLKMNFILNQKSTQEKTSSGLVSDEKYRESEESIRDLELYGNEYFSIEMHFIAIDNDQKELLKRIEQAENALTAIGEYYHEVVGSYHSYASTLLGAKTHFGKSERLIEKDSNISCYLPIFFQGARLSYIHNARIVFELNRSSLGYHRNDGSLDFFNVYDQNNSSYSSLIIGQPGKGKSVLVNQIIRALLYNESTSIVVLDVKGSYKRQCEFLNGKLFEVDWNNSAFINPLSFLTNEKVLNNSNSIEIIYQLIQNLVLDKHESELNSKDEIELKILIKSYIKKRPKEPSIDDFKIHANNFKPEQLSRWTKGGIYEHVFSSSLEGAEIKNTSILERFKYFNFQDIAQATNKTLSSALMSSIMAEVLMHFLIKDIDQQFVFVVDESPFFVKHCFESFKFLVKNVRKMNGSLFIVVQKSTDLIVNQQTDLISDIPNKIIFTSDGSETAFRELMQFEESEIEMIKNLNTENRKYAKFFLKDYYGGRTGSIVLSPEEYWRSTTHPQDLSVIEKIKHIFPNARYEAINEMIVKMEEYL
jgi:type IV secretory pathway VirB4 component